LKRKELIESITQIRTVSGCVVDLDGMINRLDQAFPGRDVGRLIFDPPEGKELSGEEIADRLGVE